MDDFKRLLEEIRREENYNRLALRHNSVTRDVNHLWPYRNGAFIRLSTYVDGLLTTALSDTVSPDAH